MKKIFAAIAIVLLVGSMALNAAKACTTAYFAWTWDSSVDTEALSVKMYSTDFYNAINSLARIFCWNGISSKIHVIIYSSGANSMDNAANINFHSVEIPGGAIGLTHIYKKNIFGNFVEIYNSSSNEKVAQVRIDLHPVLLNATEEERGRTVTHELGHAFALKHPVSNDCTARCIMQQTDSGYASNMIAQHDRNNLTTKWGN